MDDARPPEPGIDARWTASIPDEAQRRIATAIDGNDLRLVWNNSIEKFQVILRAEECLTVFQDGALDGWEIIGTFDPPLEVETIISTLRSRQQFVMWKLRQMGYGTENDTDADVLNAYLDDAPRIMAQASEKAWDDALSDYLDGAVARGRDEEAVAKKNYRRMRDATTNRRAHANYKLVVPASPAGAARYVRERFKP